jgi:uncharacterized membrane-anchored protein YitT (DUF2179 family)
LNLIPYLVSLAETAGLRKTLQYIINELRTVFGGPNAENLSEYQRRRLSKRSQITTRRRMRDAVFILFGIVCAAFGLKGFLIPNEFIDGGVMGISLLTNSQSEIPLSFLIIAFNLPFIVIAWQQINPGFSLKSIAAITVLALAVELIPFTSVTDDKLLVSVFGGFFLGMGIGLTIRGGAVIDGTEILAIYLSRKNTLTVGDFILIFNIVIFSVAALLLGVSVALYAILTYLAASKTVDFILEGIEEFTGVTIISDRSKQVVDMIHNKMGRGLTIYSGKKGYGKRGESKSSTDIIFTVITRLEINRLVNEVEKIDRNAFITMQSISDTRGGMVKKRPLKDH